MPKYHGDKPRLASLNLKVPREVRERIERRARASGRSLTQECIHTLSVGVLVEDVVEAIRRMNETKWP